MSGKNPLSELIDVGKELLAEIPKAIQEISEKGLDALESPKSDSLPSEIQIRFRRNESGELVPATELEKDAVKVGTYRLIGEADLPVPIPETGTKLAEGEPAPA